MHQGTFPEVQDGLGNHPKGPGWVGGPSWRSRTVWEVLLESGTGRGTLPVVRNGSRDP